MKAFVLKFANALLSYLPTFSIRPCDVTAVTQERPNRITRFVSGDDLEDDFVAINPIADEKEKSVKSKIKQRTKVIDFFG